MEAFYEPVDERRFTATEFTRGPWDANAQHAGPPAALIGRALELCEPRDNAQMVRVTVEILRPVPIAEMEVSAEIIRGGRSVELLAGELRANGNVVLRASGWRIRTDDVGAEVLPPAPQPDPPDAAEAMTTIPWSADVGYHSAMEWRFVRGAFFRPGPATVWLRMRVPLVAGEEPTPLTRVLVPADSGNGVSATLSFNKYMFINTDLSVSLHRLPAGEWVCLDAATTIQPHGIGMAESQLFDEQGTLGRAVQNLFVARRQ